MGNISPRIKVIRGLSGVSMLKISKTCSRVRIPHRCTAARPRADDPDAGPPPCRLDSPDAHVPTPRRRRPDCSGNCGSASSHLRRVNASSASVASSRLRRPRVCAVLASAPSSHLRVFGVSAPLHLQHPRVFSVFRTSPHLQRASMPKPQSRSCSKSIRSASLRLHVSCVLTPCMLGSASSVFALWSLGRLRASRFGRLRHYLVFVSSASLACPSRKDLATP